MIDFPRIKCYKASTKGLYKDTGSCHKLCLNHSME